MATTHGIRRRLLAALCGVVAAAGFTAFAAAPAHAVSFSTLTPTNWAYVDSRTPTATHIGEDVDAPVGSWRDADGKHHQSRSYFTYDLRALRGLTLVGATEAFSETQVFDCSHIRAMQLWTTAPITASSTWRTPPAELAKVADVASQRCPADYYGVPITDAIRSAIAAGEDSITLEWRVPDDLEGNPHLGRFIDRSPKI